MDHTELRILIRGAGELASATAHHLHTAGFRRILMLERAQPKAVRRKVCYSEAVFDGSKTVGSVTARLTSDLQRVALIQDRGDIAISTIDLHPVLETYSPDIFIEGAMLHENWGLTRDLAPVVIALGPGYTAGKDCHAVVDTFRGPQVGAVFGDTGEHIVDEPPASIMGYSKERVLEAPRSGVFFTQSSIGDEAELGQRLGMVVSVYGVEDYRRGVPVDAASPVKARLSGVIRGLLRTGVKVEAGDKLGDIDPRGRTNDLDNISDKSQRVADGVHEALIDLLAERAAQAESTGTG